MQETVTGEYFAKKLTEFNSTVFGLFKISKKGCNL